MFICLGPENIDSGRSKKQRRDNKSRTKPVKVEDSPINDVDSPPAPSYSPLMPEEEEVTLNTKLNKPSASTLSPKSLPEPEQLLRALQVSWS